MTRKRKIIVLSIAAPVALIIAAGAAGKPPAHSAVTAQATTTQATTQAAPAAPAPAPSPDGTYTGSCDYTLGSDPVDGTAVAVGEIDVTNTGNIGTDLRVTISWPQEGYDPITAVRHIRLPAGASRAVRFHVPLSGTQLDNLQNWQEGHGFADGCGYHSVITGTYGAAR